MKKTDKFTTQEKSISFWNGNKISPNVEEEFAKVDRTTLKFLRISRIMCFAPVIIKKTNDSDAAQSWEIKYSPGWNKYSIIMAPIYLGITFRGLLSNAQQLMHASPFKAVTVHILIGLNWCLLVIFTTVVTIRGKRHMNDIIRVFRLAEKAENLVLWAHQKSDLVKKDNFGSKSFSVLIYWILIIILQMIARQLPSYEDTYDLITFNINMAMFFSLYCFNTVGLLLITSCINDLIQKLNLVNEAFKTFITDLDTPKPMSNLSHSETNAEISGNIKRSKVSDIMQARELLSKAARILDKTFGFIQVVIFSSTPIHLVVSIFNMISTLSKVHEWALMIAYMSWCIGHVIKLSILIECCHAVAKKGKESECIATKMLTITTDKNIKADVKIFLYLLKRRPIYFTCMGIHIVDRGIIGSITGVVITLLVILMQYGK